MSASKRSRPALSIHAKCATLGEIDGRTVICGKSKGHDESRDPKHREHYDPSADKRWTDDAEGGVT